MTLRDNRRVGVAVREPRLDFGMINDAKCHISVPETEWLEYVSARYDFEVRHDKLWSRITKRDRKRLVK